MTGREQKLDLGRLRSRLIVVLTGVMIVAVWSGLGYDMVIFLAGMQGIPADLYDAARIVDNCEHIHFFQRTVVRVVGSRSSHCLPRAATSGAAARTTTP